MTGNKAKVTLNPLGIVATGENEQASIGRFLEVKADSAGEVTAMYGLPLDTGIGHFLANSASVMAPFSPVSGQMSLKAYSLGDNAGNVLKHFKVSDKEALATSLANDSPAVFTARCSGCSHVSTSDNKQLLKFCTLCGDELPQDDEGEESAEIDLTVTDQDDEPDYSASSISMEDENEPWVRRDGAAGAEDLFPDAEEEDLGAAADGVPPTEGGDNTGEEAPAVSATAANELTEVPQVTEKDADAPPPAADATPPAAVVTQPEPKSDDKPAEEEPKAPVAKTDEPAAATASALTEDSLVKVSTLTDVVAADATPGNAAMRLVYVPAALAGASEWLAVVNGIPAAAVSQAQATKANPDLATRFSEQAFASATIALCSQLGIQKGLTQLGFESYAFDLPIKNIVAAKVAEATAAANQRTEDVVEEIASSIQAALSASWIAHCKNFFEEDNNSLKAGFFDALSSAGVMNPREVVESVFQQDGDDFGRSLIARAFHLLELDVQARNQVVAAIASSNVLSPGDTGVSLSSAVSVQLGELGSTQEATVVVEGGKKHREAQGLRKALATLGR